MIQLTDEQLNNLNKEALVIIASSLQISLFSCRNSLTMPTLNWLIQIARLNFSLSKCELWISVSSIKNRSFFRNWGSAFFFYSFNEVEATTDASDPEPEITEVIISSYKRSKAKEKSEADLDGLPARIIEHKTFWWRTYWKVTKWL